MATNDRKWPNMGQQYGGKQVKDDGRLVSWKRIARYLDRGERTVRRWAAEEGLPVHRVSATRNSSVYAYTREIDHWLDQRDAPQPTRRPILALLPLDNLGSGEAFDAVVDGLTEEVISTLGQLNELGVIARTSIMAYKGTTLSIADIGRQLNATYVIEGSVRTEGNQARVTLQLITVADQTHLWVKHYDHSLTSPMAMQRDIARQVAADVGQLLTGKPAEVHDNRAIIDGPGAEEYFQGRYLLNQLNAASLRASAAAFDRAIALEPEFGPAYGGKAEALQLLTNFSQTSPAEVMPQAVKAINSAVAFAPNSAEVFASLGYIHSTYTREWAAAEKAFAQSLALNSSLVAGHQWYAEMLATLGRFDEAMAHAREARHLDPLSLAVECSIGHVLWLARRYDELFAAMDRVLSKAPDYPLAHILKVSGLVERGDYQQAAQAAMHAIQATGEPMPFAFFAKLAAGAAGEPEQFVECRQMLEAGAAHGYVSRYFFATLDTYAGDRQAAIANLDLACDEGGWHVIMLGQCALFDSLRHMQGFNRVLQKIGLYDCRFQVY